MLLSGFGALGFGRLCGLRRGEFCRSNLADLDRAGKLFEVFGALGSWAVSCGQNSGLYNFEISGLLYTIGQKQNSHYG
jgi:hypothetical protein